MNRNLSLYLDAVRFFAALGVLFSHFVMGRWTGGFFPAYAQNLINQIGVDLVMVFFVLSGFVIAYTTDVKDRSWREYAFSRATRIYSVAIPAVFLTYFFDWAGMAADPQSYAGWWYDERSLGEMLLRGLTFTSEFWVSVMRLGTNGPYWSLSYEIWYYVLFGLALFWRGWLGGLVCAVILLLAGPGIFLLSAIWLMGVLLYRLMKGGWLARHAAGRAGLAAGAAAAVLPVVVYGALHALDVNYLLSDLSAQTLAPLNQNGALWRADGFLWHWLVGALVFIQFAGVAVLAERIKLDAPARLAGAVRWLAGGSFSIYVIHYPAMQAIDAALPGANDHPLRMAALLAAGLAVCFLFAEHFERRLGLFRRWLRPLVLPGGKPKTA